MDFPTKRQFIFDQLLKRIRVAVESDGFQSGHKPEDVFDAYDSADSLSQLDSVEKSVEGYSKYSAENFADIRNKIADIRKELSNYSDKIARNAEIGNVDLDKVPPSVFDKQARLFERVNKSKLTVVSPSYFI